MTTMAHSHHNKQQRVPVALQSVFLASNRGNEVHSPPPQSAAMKLFSTFRHHNKGLVYDNVPLSPCDSPTRKMQRTFYLRSPLRRMKEPPMAMKLAEASPAKTIDNTPIKPKMVSPKENIRLPSLSPQTYLDALMSNRGYCTDRIKATDSAYKNTPTPLQRASYQLHLVNLMKSGDLQSFSSLMSSGVSLNPSNQFGESLCHLVCRLGDEKMLKVLLDCGATLDVCDDYGRTPLHDACWSKEPAFEIVDLIMKAGSGNTYHLFNMVDDRGSTPLSYIRQEHWARWMEFLVSKKDIYWPARDKSMGKKGPPLVAYESPQSRPYPDPENALTPDLASKVASGAMSPIEASRLMDGSLMQDDDSSYASDSDGSESNDSGCQSIDYSDDDDDYDDMEEDSLDALDWSLYEKKVSNQHILFTDSKLLRVPSYNSSRALTRIPPVGCLCLVHQ